MTTDPTDPLLSTRQTARMLGMSERTLERWRDEGCGPPHYCISAGGRGSRHYVRYRRSEVEAWLRERAR